MYEYLRGDLTGKTPTSVVVEAGGIGYRAEVSLRTSEALPTVGKSVLLLLHHRVQEDRFRLFGFVDETERTIFRALLSIAGVGPAHSLALLSGMDPDAIWLCLRDGDAKTLARTKGIGPKIAQRICTELADRARRQTAVAAVASAIKAGAPQHDDAVSALLVLGYTEPQAQKAVVQALKTTGEDADVQDVIRQALQGS